MSREVVVCYFILQYYILSVLGQETISISIPDETLDKDDLPESNNTQILRYGHHRTHDCQDFKKAFICIMKCLEFGFQIAQSNDKCKCTCYKDPVKAKYFKKVTKGWQLPITSLPYWAVKNDAINAGNATDSDSDNEHPGTEEKGFVDKKKTTTGNSSAEDESAAEEGVSAENETTVEGEEAGEEEETGDEEETSENENTVEEEEIAEEEGNVEEEGAEYEAADKEENAAENE